MKVDGGMIRSSNQVRQAIDFVGIENGKIHPSDIDAILEFDNEALIIIEVKKQGCEIPTGQRLVLERITDSWHTNTKSICLFVTHSFKEDDKDIPLQECFVERYYYKNKWKITDHKPLKEALNLLGEIWNIQKLKFTK